MALWQQFTNGNPGPLVDTDKGQGITANGDWLLLRSNLDKTREFSLGASTKVATHTATIQLFAVTAAGAKQSLDTALTPVFGTPVVWANEYTLNGDRGITVSGIVGTVYPTVHQ
jgi:hypothetical protein